MVCAINPMLKYRRALGAERSALSTEPYQRLVPFSRSVPHNSSRIARRRPGASGMGMGRLGVSLPGFRDALRGTRGK